MLDEKLAQFQFLDYFRCLHKKSSPLIFVIPLSVSSKDFAAMLPNSIIN